MAEIIRTTPHPTPALQDKKSSSGKGPGARKKYKPQARAPWLWAIPALVILLLVHFVPVVFGLQYSFTNWNGLSSPSWVGVKNYQTILADPASARALGNTLIFAVLFFVTVNGLGLPLALALRHTLKTRGILRSLFFLPIVISPLAVGIMWRYIVDFEGGFNAFLNAIGLDSWRQAWNGDPKWAMWTVVIALIWQYTGLSMVIYLAGLSRIPEELLEAAEVDGAGPYARFWAITFPLLAPAVTVCGTLTMIYGLRLFDQILAITGGGPNKATETLATQIYSQTFANGRFGYGTALAAVLTVLVTLLAFAQLVILRRREKAIS